MPFSFSHLIVVGVHSPQVVLLVQTVLLGQGDPEDHVPLAIHVEI
jgi:hypothetical protein